MGMYTCSAESVKDLFYHNGPENCGQLEIAGIEVTCLVIINTFIITVFCWLYLLVLLLLSLLLLLVFS